MYILLRWLINAVVIYLIASYYPGVSVSSFWLALLVVVVFGLVNAVLGGVLKLLTLPINILTLGFFGFVINGAMFWLTSVLISGFSVAGFWTAFWAALIYSVVTAVTGLFVKK